MTESNTATRAPDITDSMEDSMLAALRTYPPCEMEEGFEVKKAMRNSAPLASILHGALAPKLNSALLFTSAYSREDPTGVAFRAARMAAAQSSGRVLYIHVSSRLPAFFQDIESKIPIALDDFYETGGGSVLPFVVLEESGLVCATFLGPKECVNRENLKTLMASLRRCFDFTFIGGDDLLAGGTATVFSDVVDGTILVTEAERTRAPVAKRLKRAVEENGGKVVGVILNRRKYYIPDWIYRLLYGGAY